MPVGLASGLVVVLSTTSEFGLGARSWGVRWRRGLRLEAVLRLLAMVGLVGRLDTVGEQKDLSAEHGRVAGERLNIFDAKGSRVISVPFLANP